MKIELHIGELVLHGFRGTDRDAIGEEVRREIARLLSDRSAAAGEGTAAQIAEGIVFAIEPHLKAR